MGATVAPDHILKELTELWVSLGKQDSAGGAGVLRACSMTLVILAEESEDVAGLGETIAALMPEHPARTIIIRLRGKGEHTLTERVYAQCWMPFGQRRQICCEQIEITASDAALADLAPVVLPLAVPDLPVTVWCRSARLLEMKQFRGIEAMAHKLVVDSSMMPDPRSALTRMAEAVGRGVMLGDLSWTRLTRRREMLSQVFENKRNLAMLENLTDVTVTYGGVYGVPAWYLGAWITDALRAGGVTPKLHVSGGAADNGLSVELTGEGVMVRLARNQERLEITVNDFSTCTNLPQSTDYLLVREELGIVRHDTVFESTLASAAALAYATN